MSEGKKISRRDFLKRVVVAAGGVLLASCTEELSKVKNEFNRLKNVVEDPSPEYEEVVSEIELFKGDTGKKIIIKINYFTTEDKLQIRKKNGEYCCQEFEPGTEKVRLVGEVLKPRLYKVDVDRNLVTSDTVDVYPTTRGNKITNKGRESFPEGSEIHGIPVIVAPNNYFPDTKLPKETNARPPAESWMNLGEFGKGYLVGRLRTDIENVSEFTALGYVCDARALKILD